MELYFFTAWICSIVLTGITIYNYISHRIYHRDSYKYILTLMEANLIGTLSFILYFIIFSLILWIGIIAFGIIVFLLFIEYINNYALGAWENGKNRSNSSKEFFKV